MKTIEVDFDNLQTCTFRNCKFPTY